MLYSRNALMRSLEHPLDSLTATSAVAAMIEFQRNYRPQHAELDELWCTWGPRDGVFLFSLERRMLRHEYTPATLSLELAYALTPARAALSGAEPWTIANAGYRAIARATVLHRTITLRGGAPLSS